MYNVCMLALGCVVGFMFICYVHTLFRSIGYLSNMTYVNSAFHLSYNMLLNQIRCEDGDPEKLLRNSFYQFQSDQSLPDLEVC